METVSKEWIMESWSLHYHVFKFLKNGGDRVVAAQRWGKARVVYFLDWIKNNE
jgi:hypothetical protein